MTIFLSFILNYPIEFDHVNVCLIVPDTLSFKLIKLKQCAITRKWQASIFRTECKKLKWSARFQAFFKILFESVRSSPSFRILFESEERRNCRENTQDIGFVEKTVRITTAIVIGKR